MIRSSFFGFSIAQLGLSASQTGLDVTGNNIANLNTEGYTRQVVDQYSIGTYDYYGQFGKLASTIVCQGVAVNQVNQVRDSFLDVRYRSEAADVGELDTTLSALSDLEDIFSEIAKDSGISAQFDEIIKDLQTYASYPYKGELETIVQSSMETLTKLFNQYSNQIDTVYEEQLYKLEDVNVEKVNVLLDNIASLTKTIEKDELLNGNPLDLYDQRNNLLDELALYIDIDVDYTPVSYGSTVVEELVVSISDGNGGKISLVDGEFSAEFSVSISETTGEVLLSVSDFAGENFQVVNDILETGSLKGSLDILNGDGVFSDPADDYKGIQYYAGYLDTLANAFAEAFNSLNIAEGALFTSGADGGTITAGNIQIADGWRDGEYGIDTSTDWYPDGADTSGANDNIIRMIEIFSKDLDFYTSEGKNLFNGSFTEAFVDISSILGLQINSEENLLSNHYTVLATVQGLKDSVSAVSFDEEGMNLMKYQQAYNACARVMTTMDEALDRIINNMGLVGR